MIKLDSVKAGDPEIKLLTSTASLKKQESSGKTSICALLAITKPLMCGSQQTVENSSRDGNARPPDLPPKKLISRSRSNSQNWTWNNRPVPSWERLYIVTLLISLICRAHHEKCWVG